VLSGIVVSESFGSVTLAKADGATEVILRQNIADMRSSKLSLMPEGLVKDLRPPDMADLLAYLKALPSKKGAAGYWRLEHDGADSAGAVSDAAVVGIGENNRPRFIDDVPARWIHDPLTGATQQNTGAVRFDGKDDYLRLGNGDSTDLDSDALTVAQTFEAFVRLDAPVTGGTHAGLLLGKWNQVTDGGDHLALFLHGDGSIQCGAQASRTWFEETHNSGAGGKLEVGKWHHVAGVYQYDVGKREATVTVYQDYKVVSTTSYEARGPLRRARISYQLGGEGDAESGGIRFVAATFDEVRISDAVLTPEEFLRAGDAPASK
jgi:hypothetical protein